jgi:hypothetical protein
MAHATSSPTAFDANGKPIRCGSRVRVVHSPTSVGTIYELHRRAHGFVDRATVMLYDDHGAPRYQYIQLLCSELVCVDSEIAIDQLSMAQPVDRETSIEADHLKLCIACAYCPRRRRY